MKSPQTHLLVSVFLTDKSLGTPYGRHISPTQSKADQFLSAVHSISNLPLATQDFYIAYHDQYLWVKSFISKAIIDFFPNARIYDYSLETFSAWQDAAARVPKESKQILLKANHDHVYVRESSREFEEFVMELQTFGDRYVGEITHWPEIIGSNNVVAKKMPSRNLQSFQSTTKAALGTSIISKALFLEWWTKDFTGGKMIIRPDNPFGPSVAFPSCVLVVPKTELFRHLDGYGHSGVHAPSAAPLRACCQLINGEVIHNDWVYGNFLFSRKNKDIPKLPVIGERKTIASYLQLILLASAHNFNEKNLRVLLESYAFPFKSARKISFFILLTNPYFLAKMPKPFLRFLGLMPILKYLRDKVKAQKL
jgi:hypothetical protein